MKPFLFFITLITLLGLGRPSMAQNEAGPPIWQVTSFDVTVNLPPADRSIACVAILNATNVGGSAGRTLTARMHSKASVKSVAVAGATATFRGGTEPRGDLQKVEVSLPSSIAPSQSVSVTINYSLPIEINTGLSAISPGQSQFLPLSFWYPMPNTPYTVRGADAAPFKLTVNATNVVSSGVEKSGQGGATVFEQPLSSFPFFTQGEWDRSEGAGDARGIWLYVPKGLPAEQRKQADALSTFAASARAYFSTALGPAPEVPLRLVAVRRGFGFGEGGTILVDEAVFRRAKLDATTALAVAEGIGRMWIGGQVPVRGEGNGVVHDGLVRFLAILAIEKQFGRDAAQAELLRSQIAYASVVKRDPPLARSNQLDATYFASVPNRGAMTWRLIDQLMGHDNFMTVVRGTLQAAKSEQRGLTLAALRTALADRGGANLKAVIDQHLDQVIDTDLLVGLPQQRGTDWVSQLRNLGSIDVTVPVVATTDRGERLTSQVSIANKNFAEAIFKTTSKVVRVEIDPEKLYPQVEFGNDVVPRVKELQESLGAVSLQLSAQDFAKAEGTARDMLVAAPRLQEARIFLGRAQLGQGKLDEAEKTFRSVLDDPLPTPFSMASANLGLAEISMKRGQAAEAAKRFGEAVKAGGDYASSLAARAGRIRAETESNTAPPIDESARAFISQLGPAIVGGKKTELDARIVSGELVRFVNASVGTAAWETRVLRTEQLNANLIEADVAIKLNKLGKEGSGTAVMVLTRTPNGLKLANIDLFEVQ